METVANTLFTYDQSGRMLQVNEPDGDIAPRFFLGRSGERNLWRVRHDMPHDVVQQLDALCRQEPVTDTWTTPPTQFDALCSVLEAHTPIRDIYRGPEYAFPDETLSTSPAHIPVHRLAASDADCLRPHFAYLIPMLIAGDGPAQPQGPPWPSPSMAPQTATYGPRGLDGPWPLNHPSKGGIGPLS